MSLLDESSGDELYEDIDTAHESLIHKAEMEKLRSQHDKYVREADEICDELQPLRQRLQVINRKRLAEHDKRMADVEASGKSPVDQSMARIYMKYSDEYNQLGVEKEGIEKKISKLEASRQEAMTCAAVKEKRIEALDKSVKAVIVDVGVKATVEKAQETELDRLKRLHQEEIESKDARLEKMNKMLYEKDAELQKMEEMNENLEKSKINEAVMQVQLEQHEKNAELEDKRFSDLDAVFIRYDQLQQLAVNNLLSLLLLNIIAISALGRALEAFQCDWCLAVVVMVVIDILIYFFGSIYYHDDFAQVFNAYNEIMRSQQRQLLKAADENTKASDKLNVDDKYLLKGRRRPAEMAKTVY